MKIVTFLLLFSISSIYAQYRDQPKIDIANSQGITNNSPSNFILNFFNPQNFSMHHSIGMSYSSFSGQGVALGVYTNDMIFKLGDNFNVQLETSIVNSPYNTLGTKFTKNINGIYLSRVSLNYKPFDNTSFHIEYRGGPGYYSPYGYSNYGMNSFRDYFYNNWLEN